MRDIKGAFQRTSEISREVSKTSSWLEDFAEQMYLKEQTTKTASLTKEARAVTAVEVARNSRTQAQPSIYEMMSAIVSGNKPKFSSVDEAVKHYQESTGLAQYLKAQEDERMASYAALVSSADDSNDVMDTTPSPIGPSTNTGAEVALADDRDEEKDEEKEKEDDEKSKSKKEKDKDDEDEDEDEEDEDEDEEDEDEDDCSFNTLASVIRQFRLNVDGSSKKKV